MPLGTLLLKSRRTLDSVIIPYKVIYRLLITVFGIITNHYRPTIRVQVIMTSAQENQL